MSLPYNTLTPILGEQATDHTPESETTPDFMNGKFDELLENDKKLDEQINDLNNDVIHLSDVKTSIISGTADYNTFTAKGRYTGDFYTSNQKNAPFSNANVSSGELIVSQQSSNVLKQTLSIYARYNVGNVYTRYFSISSATWTDWQQIATTTKTPFLCTAKTGYNIISQDCYTKGGKVSITITVEKTDGTLFTQGSSNNVANSPNKKAVFINAKATEWTAGNELLPNTPSSILLDNGNIFANVLGSGTKRIIISCEFDL